MMENKVDQVLESLRPHSEGMIMDLVEKAGIDVSPWGVRKDGAVVKNPRANPTYCYEWAFGGSGEPTALCVWHKDIKTFQKQIVFDDNLRNFALKLDLVAIERSNPSHVKSRARDQAKRARNFDSLLQRAFRKSEPVRVVLLLGDDNGSDKLGWDTSKVKFRALDSDAWYAHSYSDVDGAFRLVRSIPLDSTFASNNETVTPPVFEDQFSVPETPQKRESVGNAFVRSQDVRQTVLRRAAGVCECCGAHGFKTASGAIFLETHHVIPLSENGPDIKWNVAAICPNDHRRAHYGDDRVAIRDRLIANLSKTFPAAERLFAVLLESQQRIFPKQ